MNLLRGFEDPAAYRGGFVSIGNFDGVHRGHQSMIAALVRNSRSMGVPAVVFTFEPHPIRILRPERTPPSLSTLERKSELLMRHGVDCVIAYPTDRALLSLTPQEFFQQIIVDELQAQGLVEGPNFCFGRDRAGDISTLQDLCDKAGMVLEIVEPMKLGDTLVSSSAIRSLIAGGEMARAVELLGHPYRVCGTVARGAVRGRSIGFPTANLEDVETLLPCDGVYAGASYFADELYPAAIHLGPNPTFEEDRRKLEVHLVGYDGELYGQRLDVDIFERLRDTRRFEGPDELRRQLQRDVKAVRAVAKKKAPG